MLSPARNRSRRTHHHLKRAHNNEPRGVSSVSLRRRCSEVEFVHRSRVRSSVLTASVNGCSCARSRVSADAPATGSFADVINGGGSSRKDSAGVKQSGRELLCFASSVASARESCSDDNSARYSGATSPTEATAAAGGKKGQQQFQQRVTASPSVRMRRAVATRVPVASAASDSAASARSQRLLPAPRR